MKINTRYEQLKAAAAAGAITDGERWELHLIETWVSAASPVASELKELYKNHSVAMGVVLDEDDATVIITSRRKEILKVTTPREDLAVFLLIGAALGYLPKAAILVALTAYKAEQLRRMERHEQN